MKCRASILALVAAASLAAAEPSRLDVARRALGDGLWNVAAKVAAEAAAGAADDTQRAAARLVEIEALAGAGRTDDLLARLEAWPEASGEGFVYWRAWANLERGKLDAARRLLASDFKSPPYDVLALRLSARAAVLAGDRAAAEALFAKAAAALAGDPSARAENAVEWARALARFDDVPGALAVLAKENAASVKGPAGDAARLLAAQLSLRTGHADSARSLLEALVAAGTNTEERVYVQAACALSDAYFSAGATNDARRVASNAVARASRPALVCQAGFTLGFVLLADAATRAQGRELISSLVRKYTGEADSGAAQLRLADDLLAVGDAAAAAREYDVLLQAYPEHTLDVHVLEGRGFAFARLGRHAEAVGMFARAAQVATNVATRARCVFEQAEALFSDERFDEAAAAYGAVPEGMLRAAAQFRQAESLLRARHTDEAARLFRALMGAGGENAVEAALRVASLEGARGHFEQAIADYGTVLSAKPLQTPTVEQRVRALYGRGRALYHAYRFREAEADFATVAKLRPARRDEMGFLTVLCLYGDGRDREAYAAARALLATVPDSALRCDLQFWVAKFEAGRREWTTAIAGFEACMTNEHATATRRLESIVRAAHCAKSLSDFPKVLELTGRVERNAPSVDAAAKATPETALVAEALVLQGEALKELSRFDGAVLVFERAGRMPVSEELRYLAEVSRADCLFAMGADDAKCYRDALEAYRTLLQGAKLTPSARLELAFKVGRALEKLHRFEEAVEEYYTHVVLAYWNAVRPEGKDAAQRVWFDGTARAFFARAAFILADYHESRGELRQAVKMLEYLVAARVSSADEAKRRIRRLKEKGGF
ncbi:MAG: hypothetical protein ACI4RA_09125 [Kiritimatiellia bacterium]